LLLLSHWHPATGEPLWIDPVAIVAHAFVAVGLAVQGETNIGSAFVLLLLLLAVLLRRRAFDMARACALTGTGYFMAAWMGGSTSPKARKLKRKSLPFKREGESDENVVTMAPR